MSKKTLLFTECVDFVGSACKPFVGMKKYVSTGAVDVDHIIDSDTEIVDYDGKPSRANLEAMAGDVLFAKMQGTKKTLMIDSVLADYIYSTGFCAIRAKNGILTDRCLYHLLTSDMFLSQKDKNCSGATQKAITNAGLGKIVICVPSTEMQNDIADQLDAVISIITKRQQELSALDDMIKARFVEMFGTVDNNVFNYPVVRLGKYAKLQGGYAFKSKDFVDNGVPLVQIGNVNKDYLDWEVINAVPNEYLEKYSEFSLRDGDLVMAMTRPIIKSLDSVKIAKVSKSDVPSLLNQRVGRFVMSGSLNREFLETLCKSNDFKDYVERMSGNSLQPNISSKQVEDYMIILPPTDLQEQFAEFVKQVDKSKVVVQKALDEAQVLFDSLMQKYFG